MLSHMNEKKLTQGMSKERYSVITFKSKYMYLTWSIRGRYQLYRPSPAVHRCVFIRNWCEGFFNLNAVSSEIIRYVFSCTHFRNMASIDLFLFSLQHKLHQNFYINNTMIYGLPNI